MKNANSLEMLDKTDKQVVNTDIAEQVSYAEAIKLQHGVLLTQWVAEDLTSNTTQWYVLYHYKNHTLCLMSTLRGRRPFLIDLSEFFPVASRLQRAIHDLTKIKSKKMKDRRPWLNHGYFPIGVLNPHQTSKRYAKKSYPFGKISGDGVHEIPVGPVHAGVIEPGHFRFSVVGEHIIKLEERLGYTHKGIHSLLLNKSITDATKLIARVSGDSTVAYGYAFALACEQSLGFTPDRATQCMRAVLLERERLINHIGDIGAIVNDTGFVSLATQFSMLKEKLVRENEKLTGHRYMMDSITACQELPLWSETVMAKIKQQLTMLRADILELMRICERHHGLQDRVKTTGILDYDTACSLGVIGFLAKASGISIDSRTASNIYPYSDIDFMPVTAKTGDVGARMHVRFEEALQSIGLIEQFLLMSKTYSSSKKQAQVDANRIAIACVEGWRGTVVIALKLQEAKVMWCHFHDPSWQNWQALSYAVMNNIVADFPLINKSFNLSYSAVDC